MQWEASFTPKYIIIIPDKDIITSLKCYNIGASVVMGAALHYLIRQFDILIDRWRVDLLDKKPGAIIDEPDDKDSMPKIVWIQMLKKAATSHWGYA